MLRSILPLPRRGEQKPMRLPACEGPRRSCESFTDQPEDRAGRFEQSRAVAWAVGCGRLLMPPFCSSFGVAKGENAVKAAAPGLLGTR